MARWKLLWIAAVAALGLAVAPAAGARTLRLSGTERGAIISTAGNTTIYAALGSTQVGAYAAQNSTTASTPAAGATSAPFTSRFIDYYGAGTMRGTLTGTASTPVNGVTSFTGTGRITSGTGTFRKARGTLTFTGTQTADGRYTVKVTGTLRY